MKLSELFRLHLIKRLPAIIGAALITAFIALYYVGVLDVSFIQRPEAWSDNLNSFLGVFSSAKDDEKEPGDSTEKEPDNKEPADTAPAPEANKPTKPQKPENNSTPAPQAQILKFSDVATLIGEGYRVTDKPWAEGFVFGKLQMEYQWPRDFSYSFKTEYSEKVTEYDDGTEKTKETIANTVQRPAIELYMGYILYDDNGSLYILGPEGTVLSKYNDKEFIPAYTRDLAGRPLFYKKTKQNVIYPTSLGEEDENGNKKWDKTSYITVDAKDYYYLAPNGQTFMKSDYNDVTDNRGLYFDYPAYYGNASTLLTRYFLNTTKVITNAKGDTFLKNCMNWLFSQEKLKLEEYKFDSDGVRITEKLPHEEEEVVQTIDSLFPYTMAYNYSENYATVFMDIDWSYEHDVGPEGQKERMSFDVTTNEMRIIDSKGNVMFDSRKNFFSSLKWTAHEQFAAPIYTGIESLGSYYFDHGYMRMRIQSYDCYHFAEFGLKKVVTDEDVLVSPSGKRFDIPSGYTLISYSDGILLLERKGEYGYLNTLGNWIRDPELLDAKPFIEGVAVCKNIEGNYGVIDTSGKAIIPFNYDYISNISSGTIAAFSKTTGWTVFQKMSK